MILQALVKYYENLAEQGKVSRLGWCHAKVSYEINMSSMGDIIGITSRKIEDMRGKKQQKHRLHSIQNTIKFRITFSYLYSLLLHVYYNK